MFSIIRSPNEVPAEPGREAIWEALGGPRAGPGGLRNGWKFMKMLINLVFSAKSMPKGVPDIRGAFFVHNISFARTKHDSYYNLKRLIKENQGFM